MYTVYTLRSLVDGHLYIGMTNNLERRLYEHNIGHTKSTKARAPFRVIYQEDLPDRVSARKREKILKSGSGREYLKQFLNNPE